MFRPNRDVFRPARPFVFSWRRCGRAVRPAGAAFLLGLVAALGLRAQTAVTWTGTTSNVWATGTNWSGGAAPTSSDVATFANTVTNTSPTLANATTYTLAGINVTGGSAITIGGGDSSTHLQIGTSGITNSNGSTALTISSSGDLSTASSGGTLTLSGTGTGGIVGTAIVNNGTSSLTKSGTGDWALTGSNTYTGVTRVDVGTLEVKTLANGGSASSIGASSNAASNLVIADGGTVNPVLLFTGTSNSSTDRLFTIGTYGASITNNGTGTLQFTNTGSIAFAGSGARSFYLRGSNTGSNVFAPVIGDDAGGATYFTKFGTGTWALTGSNTYTGTTTISAGVLQVSSLANGGSASGIGASSNAAANLVLANSSSNAALKYTGSTNASTDRLFTIGSGGAIIDSSGTGTLSFTNTGSIAFSNSGSRTFYLQGSNTGANTFAPVIGDNGGSTGFTKFDAGKWVLTGANTYTGATTLYGGTVAASSLANGGTASNLGASTNAASNLVFRGGTLQYTGAAVSTDRLFTVGTEGGAIDASGTGALNLTNTGSVAFTGSGTRTLTLAGSNTGSNTLAAIVGDSGGATSLTKSGSGTWVLSGANTYTGATTISAGTLQLGASGVIADTAAVSVSSGATFDVNGKTETIGSLAGAGSVTLGAGALTTGGANTFTTFSGLISGTGSLTLDSASTGMALTGANTYTGATTVTRGELDFSTVANGGTASGLGASSNAASNLVLNGGGYLVYTGSTTGSTDRLFSLGTGGGVLYAYGSGALQFTNTGAMGFVGSGTRTLYLRADNTAANSLAVAIGDNGGATTLEKNGTGTWTLSGTNTYTGTTTISAGALNLQNAAALGSTSGGTTVASGAALQLQGDITVGSEALTLSGTGVSSDGALRNISGNNTYGGLITLGAATRINSDAGTLTLSNTGTITGSGFGLTVGGAGNTSIASIIGTGAGGLTKDGAGTLTLSGANTYTGATTVSAGVLNIQNATALGTTAAGTTVASGAALQLQGDITVGSEALTLSGTGVSSDGALRNISGSNTYGGLITLGATTRINSDAGTLTLSNTGTITGSGFGLTVGGAGNTSIASIIGTGAGTLTKDGTGTLTLSGANTYTGATTVSGGKLSISSLADGGSASQIGASSNAASNLVLNGGTLLYTGSAVSTDRLFSVGTSNAIIVSSGSGALNFTNTGAMGFNGQSGPRTLYLEGTNTGANTLAAAIGDNGGSTRVGKYGAGTWVLSGANTYSGPTSVSQGTLRAGANDSLGFQAAASSYLSLENVGTVFDLNGYTQSLNGAAGYGNITLGSGTLTLGNSNGYNFGLNYQSVISGTGSLIKTGTNTQSLYGYNTYTGGTTVNDGYLNVFGSLASTGAVTTSGSGHIYVGSTIGSLSGTGGYLTSNNLTIDQSIDTTYAGVIDGYSVTKSGSGTLTLTGNNTFSNGLFITGGVVAATTLSTGGASSVSNGAVLLNGGTLKYTGAGQSTGYNFLQLSTAGSTLDASGTGALALTYSGSAYMMNSGARTLTLTGTSTGDNTLGLGLYDYGGFTFVVKSGTGTWLLTNGNTYTGATTITGGTLKVSSLTNGGATSQIGASTNAATNLVLNGGTLQYTGGAVSTDRLFSVGTSGGTLDASGTGALNLTNTGSIGFNSQTGARTLTLTGSNTGANTLAAVLGDNSGATSLNKSGTGTWVLSGANTYTGATTISAGTLQLGASGVIADTSAVSVSSGATFDVNAKTETIGSLAGAGSVTLGAGALTAGGDNTSTTFSGLMSGTGSLTKVGTGTLTLSGANTYSGATTISSGVINVQNAAALGTTAAGTTVASGAALQLQGGITVGSEALTLSGAGVSSDGALRNISGNNPYGGLVTLGAATRINSDAGTLTLSNTGTITGSGYGLTVGGAGNTSIASIIGTGSGSLTKDGAGTLTLSGANTYTGATTVSAGVLNIQNATALGTTAAGTTIASGAALELQGGITVGAEALALAGSGVSNGGALRNISGANTYGGLVTLGAATRINSDAGTLALSNTGTITGSGYGLTVGGAGNTSIASIIGIGSGSLTKDGAGTLTLSGANTYTGATAVSAGTLQLGASGVISDSSAVSVSLGATLDVNGRSETIGSLAGAGNVVLGTGSLTVGADDTSTVFSGVISGTGNPSNPAFYKVGTGNMTLSGANTFTGMTRIDGGTLLVGSANAFGATADVRLVPVGSSATLDLNGFDITLSALLFSGQTTSSSSHVTTGTNTLTLAGYVDFNKSANPLGGTLAGNLNLGNAVRSFYINDSTSTTTELAISANISGSGGVSKEGLGTMSFSGTNSYIGGTTVNSGTLAIASTGSLASTGAITVNGGTLSFANTAGQTIASLAGSGGTVNLASGVTLTVNQTGNTGYSGSITGSGSLVKSGANTLTLSGTNSFTGGTTVTSGTLDIYTAGTLASAGAVTVNGGTIGFYNTAGQTVGSLSGTGGSVNLASGVALTINQSSNTSYGGVIGGAGSLVKSGTGLLTLSGTNTLTGATSVLGGELRLSGSAASSDFTVNGGTLSGVGTINSLSVGSGGVIAPGSSPGTLSVTGNLTYGSGSITNLELGGTARGTGFDAILVGGTITFGGTLNLSLINGFSPVAGNSFDLFDFGSVASSSTFAAVNLPSLSSGLSWDVSSLYTTGVISATATAVPEPEAFAAFAGSALLGFAGWRRRRTVR